MMHMTTSPWCDKIGAQEKSSQTVSARLARNKIPTPDLALERIKFPRLNMYFISTSRSCNAGNAWVAVDIATQDLGR